MMTNFQKNRIQGFLFGNTAFTNPTSYYIALSSSTPNVDGTGIVEPIGGGYERVEIVNTSNNFSVPVDGVTKNTGAWIYPESTAPWTGSYTHWVAFDAPTGGNALYFAPLNEPIEVNRTMLQVFIDVNGFIGTLS